MKGWGYLSLWHYPHNTEKKHEVFEKSPQLDNIQRGETEAMIKSERVSQP